MSELRTTEHQTFLVEVVTIKCDGCGVIWRPDPDKGEANWSGSHTGDHRGEADGKTIAFRLNGHRSYPEGWIEVDDGSGFNGRKHACQECAKKVRNLFL
jgi:hypothetical protein